MRWHLLQSPSLLNIKLIHGFSKHIIQSKKYLCRSCLSWHIYCLVFRDTHPIPLWDSHMQSTYIPRTLNTVLNSVLHHFDALCVTFVYLLYICSCCSPPLYCQSFKVIIFTGLVDSDTKVTFMFQRGLGSNWTVN